MEERKKNGFQMAEIGLGSAIIDITEESLWISKVSQGCLVRVPEKLLDFELGSQTNFRQRYAPQVVSIGPYHHNKEDLKLTDKYKKMYLDSLITRSTQSGVGMKELVEAIKPLEKEARGYYAEPISLTNEEFVTMMVLDGCFILEVLYRFKEKEFEDLAWGEEEMPRRAMSGGTWIEASLVQNMILRDLVLLENQLPLIVLEGLFSLTKHLEHPILLIHLLKHYFEPIMPTNQIRDDNTIQLIRGKHLLDVLRKLVLPSHKKVEHVPDDARPRDKYNIPNAKKLFHSGVTFRLNEKATSLFDINFKDGMVIEIPALYYGEGAMILLRNLVSLEQCSPNYKHQVTSYVILMSFLVETKSDVKLLGRTGIIDGSFEHYQKMATEIYGLSEGISASPFYYNDFCSRLNATLKSRWVQWRARVARDHISKLPPWAVYSCFVSILAVTGTIMQLMYR